MKSKLPDGSTYVDAVTGYVREKRDGKWQLQHRLVMSEKLGRPLLPDEIVHHLNEVKTDNAPSNLELTTRSEHVTEHRTGFKHKIETRRKQSVAGLRIGADPKERQRRSARATKQHALRSNQQT